MAEGSRLLRKQTLKLGLTVLFVNFGQFASFALSFWYGSIVVAEGDCSFEGFFKGLTGVFITPRNRKGKAGMNGREDEGFVFP
jgi:hypothetical protein